MVKRLTEKNFGSSSKCERTESIPVQVSGKVLIDMDNVSLLIQGPQVSTFVVGSPSFDHPGLGLGPDVYIKQTQHVTNNIYLTDYYKKLTFTNVIFGSEDRREFFIFMPTRDTEYGH